MLKLSRIRRFRSKLMTHEFAEDVESANLPAGHDAAKSTKDEDDLERWPVALSIYRSIRSAPLSFSTRIGLYGEWGAGKTSVLNFLQNIAMGKDDLVIQISVWQASNADNFMTTLSEKMRAEIKRRGIKDRTSSKRNQLFASMSKVTAFASRMTGQAAGKIDNDIGTAVSMAAAFTETVATAMMERLGLTSEELVQLCRLLAEHDARVIVFIDDLDRADPLILPKTLMTLREHLDLPGFAFVLAFDKEVVTHSIGEYSKSLLVGRQPFLDKMIDLEFELKPPSRALSARVGLRAMEQCCPFIPEHLRIQCSQWFPDNPRRARSIARELGGLKEVATRHGEGEIKWEALILQTLLRREVPASALIVERELLGKGKMALALSLGLESKKEVSKLHQAIFDASGYAPGSAQLGRLCQLVVKLQGLRNFQEAEQIDYEMRLGTHAPCFTQRELGELIEQWAISRRDTLLDEALGTAALKGQTSLRDCASRFLNMTLDQYAISIRQLREQTFKGQHEKALTHATHTMEFFQALSGPQRAEALVHVSGSLSICTRMLDLFITHSSLPGSQLRALESQALEHAAQRCGEKAQLFYSCMRFRSKAEFPPLAQRVHEITADAAVQEALLLFTTASGMTVCRMQALPNPLLELLSRHDSALYSPMQVAKLQAVVEAANSEEGRSVLAWNCVEYVRLLFDQTEFDYFWSDHRAILQACWKVIINEQWLTSGEEQVVYLHSRLCSWIGDKQALPLPEWAKAVEAKLAKKQTGP